MKVIYMQTTIDYIVAKHNHRLREITAMGEPIVKTLELSSNSHRDITTQNYYIIQDTTENNI